MGKVFCDGSGYSGYRSMYAVVFENGERIIKEFDKPFTSNDMEYSAVIRGLRECEEGDIIYTDSMLVVKQVHGEWRVKEKKFLPKIERINKLLEKKKAKLKFIRRGFNLAGHAIETYQKFGMLEE